MPLIEPVTTALMLLAAGALLVVSVLSSRISGRVGLPLALVFLLIGMAAGSEGVGGIAFSDYQLAFRLGTTALTLILFHGGLSTPTSALRRAIVPASLLATVGVALTAALVALAARLLGFDWPAALLLGAVVSSTDAAAVYAVLRGSGLQLHWRLGTTLELESGLNDPMAVILTTSMTALMLEGGAPTATAGLMVLWQLAAGAALGVALGLASRRLLQVQLVAAGLYPVLTVGLAFIAFSAPTLVQGSGFLAVYIAGLMVGNSRTPYLRGLLRVHDALAWLGQVGMFVMLGLLVFPSRLVDVAVPGLLLALFLALVARPAAVALCLAPFRYPPREMAYIGWVGLRGAIPIILATFPVMAGVAEAERLFNVVFFLVVVNALVPGATVGWVTRRLGLGSAAGPPPPAVLEMVATRPLNGEILSFLIESPSVASHTALQDLPLPASALVLLIVRSDRLVAPRGHTTLLPGDHVYVFCDEADVATINLLFGRREEG